MTGAEERTTAAGPRAGLARMRWWHLAEVMEAESELFGAESWSVEAFWSELAQADTRYYRVAVEPAGPGLPRPGASSASAAERLVGYAGLALIGAEAHVQVLAVRRDRQRRGIGAALLNDLLAEAARRGAGTVLLDVRADNPAAQRLYARHGFVPIGLRRRYYQPSGTDAVVMERHG